MADNFNLTGFLKKNQLLNENIGGYVDIKPTKEEVGTAMERDKDTMTASKGWQYDDDSLEYYERIMSLGGDSMLKAAQFLIDDGFEFEDIVDFLRTHIQ